MLKIKKRFMIEILLSVLVLAAGLLYSYRTPLQTGLQLVLTLNVSHSQQDTFKVLIGKQSIETRIAGTGNFQNVKFQLPREKIENLDILLGLTPGTVSIKAVKIIGAVVSHTVEGKKLKMLFQVNPGTAKYYFRKNNFYIETTNILHWLRVNKVFLTALQQMQTNKLIFYILSILLALVFFYLIHFLDVKMLKVFFSRQALVSGLWLWMLIIYFPLVDDALNLFTHSQLVERRLMNKKPQLRLDSFPDYLKSYTAFYNDYFAPRSELIYLNCYLQLKLFGLSATNKVLVGKDNWLFFHINGNQPSTVDYFRNRYPFTEIELQAWKKILEQRQQWLAARGIDYMFLLIPNKNTIYPEYMPDYLKKGASNTRMDQLLAYLKKHSTINVPDIRPALLAAKGQYLLYYRTDTHWNEYGAYVGHQELLKYMAAHFSRFKDAQPVPLSRFTIKPVNVSGGDLAEMMSLQDSVLREDNLEIIPNPPWSFTTVNLPPIGPFITQSYTETPNVHLPNILMVHDSFYKSLKPFLSELFPRCLYIWDWGVNFFPDIIEKEKPTLVIDEMVERFLLNTPPINPESIIMNKK